WIYDSLLADTVGVFGAASLLVTVYVVALIFIFTRDIGAEFDRFFANIHAWRERRAERRREKAEAKQRAKAAKAKALAEIAAAQAAAKAVALPKTLKIAKPKDDPLALPPVVNPAKTAPSAPATPDEPPPEATPRRGAAKVIGLKLSGRSDKSSAEEAAGARKLELNIVKPEETKKARATVPQSTDDNYQLPKLSLLKDPAKPHADNTEEEHQRNAENLLRILGEFGVEVSIGEIHVGT